MSEYYAPRVVIFGRSDTENSVMQQYLQDTDASQIPYDFLDTVFITYNNEKIKINKKQLKNGINYKNLDRDLENLGFNKTSISLIEIIIDLDAAYRSLQNQTSSYLDQFFY